MKLLTGSSLPLISGILTLPPTVARVTSGAVSGPQVVSGGVAGSAAVAVAANYAPQIHTERRGLATMRKCPIPTPSTAYETSPVWILSSWETDYTLPDGGSVIFRLENTLTGYKALCFRRGLYPEGYCIPAITEPDVDPPPTESEPLPESAAPAEHGQVAYGSTWGSITGEDSNETDTDNAGNETGTGTSDKIGDSAGSERTGSVTGEGLKRRQEPGEPEDDTATLFTYYDKLGLLEIYQEWSCMDKSNTTAKRVQADGRVTVITDQCTLGQEMKKGELCGVQGGGGEVYATLVELNSV